MQYDIRVHAAHAALVVALGIAVSFITSAVVASRADKARGEQAARAAPDLTVKGSARQRVESDRAVWQIYVRGDGRTLADGFAVLEAGAQRVREFLGESGFGDGEIGLAAIDTETHYVRDAEGNETPEIAGYTMRRTFTVSTPDVRRIEQAAGRVTALIEQGVHVTSGAPEYYVTQLPRMRVELMELASADARARAEKIATSTGCRLGPLRDAQMGVLQVVRPYSTEVASYGLYDTGTIEKDVQAVVSATFSIASTP